MSVMLLLVTACVIFFNILVASADQLTSINHDEQYEDAHLTTMELLKKYNYEAEEHKVTTEDGYILTAHRILPKATLCDGVKKPSVMLQHGLFCSSSNWIFTGPDLALGYALSNECYDTWMTNSRGNQYSLGHQSLSNSSSKYWEFSWHEMGIYDTPAFIDYILEHTKQKKLFYAGHSQGTTSFFLLNSLRPGYVRERVIAMIALAPVVFLGHTNSKLLKLVSQLEEVVGTVQETLGNGQFAPSHSFLASLGSKCFEASKLTADLCEDVVWAVAGSDPEQFNKSQVPVYIGQFPAGSSTKQLIHYGQCVKHNTFRPYDYGAIENTNVYKSLTPPDYPLGKADCPMALWHSDNDYFTAPEDIAHLTSLLPNIVALNRVPWEKWNHADYLIGIDAKSLVYDDVIKFLNSHSGTY